MRTIVGASDGRLTWSQESAWTRRFTLAIGDQPAGRLEFPSAFGTLAKAETGDGCWTFKRVGFWQARASVRVCGSEQDLATFENNTWTGGGTLHFVGGRRFQATTNFWQTKLQFETEAGEPIARFDYGGVFRLHADVHVASSARSMPELPVLVCFGWYLAVKLHEDAQTT